MCKLEELVSGRFCYEIKLKVKVSEPSEEDVIIYEHRLPFVSDQYLTSDYIARLSTKDCR